MLAGAAMGAVFLVIPAIILIASVAWIAARVVKGARRAPVGTRLLVAARGAREPLQVALALIGAGVVLTGFVAGDLGAGSYLRIGASTLGFMLESVTEWSNPRTSESITLRGFGFIVIASCLIVGFSMWRYYSAWLRAAEAAVTGSVGRSDP